MSMHGTSTPMLRGVVERLLGRARRAPRGALNSVGASGRGGRNSGCETALFQDTASSHGIACTATRSLCTTIPTRSPLPIGSSSYVPPSKDDPTQPYRPPLVAPVPMPGVVRTLRAVSPFPSHVETFVRAFPSFKPIGFHSVPRKAIAANPLRRDLIREVVVWQQKMWKQGTVQTKNRARVNGSTRKLRPQKGTGQARIGDKGAPNLRGGGHCFALWPREYTSTLSLKRQCLGLRAALTAKFIQNQFTLVETLKEIPPQQNKQVRPQMVGPRLTPEAVLKIYEENKDDLRRRLEHILEFNDHRNFVACKKPPREFVPQYVPVKNDIDAAHKMKLDFDSVLLCISRDPVEEKRLADMELRAGLRPPPDPIKPLGRYLDSYWNIWEAAHKSEMIEVCSANDLDCYRLMKYRNLIIEKDALDLVVDRTDF